MLYYYSTLINHKAPNMISKSFACMPMLKALLMGVILFCSLAASVAWGSSTTCELDQIVSKETAKNMQCSDSDGNLKWMCSNNDGKGGKWQRANKDTGIGKLWCVPADATACGEIEGASWNDSASSCSCEKEGQSFNKKMTKCTSGGISGDTSTNITLLMTQFLWLYQIILIVIGVVILMIGISRLKAHAEDNNRGRQLSPMATCFHFIVAIVFVGYAPIIAAFSQAVIGAGFEETATGKAFTSMYTSTTCNIVMSTDGKAIKVPDADIEPGDCYVAPSQYWYEQLKEGGESDQFEMMKTMFYSVMMVVGVIVWGLRGLRY